MNIATSPSLWIATTIAAIFAFWTCFGACIDAPLPSSTPDAKVVAAWDPLACGEPHRVVVELEDDEGVPLATSAPCNLGGLVLDAPHFGTFRGRVYAWELGKPERSIAPAYLVVDQPVVRWNLVTPR